MAERIKDKKMNIEDCVFLSKHISAYLEVDDPISSSYVLEVSSGGLARPLTIIDDYESFKYNKAKIVLKEKFLGKKTYKGFLKGIDKNGKIQDTFASFTNPMSNKIKKEIEKILN